MKICEIFYSIQGEGQWLGLPNVFIRTQGCNLRCTFCDTTYAYDEGEEKTITEILKEIKRYTCRFICITGGEPLLQQATYELIEKLCNQGYVVCIETNGSYAIDPLIKNKTVMISLDIKCPSSQMSSKMDLNNLSLIRPVDQVKFVIGTRKDYVYAKNIFSTYHIPCKVYFQPVWKQLPLQKLASWIQQDNLMVYLGIQLQKIIYGDRRKT